MNLPLKLVMACLVLFVSQTTAFAQVATKPAEAAATTGPKIAVVNIVHLFDHLKEKAAADTDLADLRGTTNATTRAMQGMVSDLQARLKAMDEKDPERAQVQEQLLNATASLKNAMDVQQQQFAREMRLRTVELYNKINEAVAAYAEANNLDLVLVADDARLNANSSQEQVQAIVATRKVLYSRNTIDITKEIEQRMNAEFEATHAGPP